MRLEPAYSGTRDPRVLDWPNLTLPEGFYFGSCSHRRDQWEVSIGCAEPGKHYATQGHGYGPTPEAALANAHAVVLAHIAENEREDELRAAAEAEARSRPKPDHRAALAAEAAELEALLGL